MIKYQYISERSVQYSLKVKSPSDVVPILKRYRKLKQEAFLVITLNGAHEVIKVRMVSVGILNRAIVHPREIFVGAIEDRSASIILCHVHPSGNLEPSKEDRDVTFRMKEAGSILGIDVLDHIIIGKGDKYYSFLESDEILVHTLTEF
nr:JAB domain-containing protein [Bacteroidales bacterium]